MKTYLTESEMLTHLYEEEQALKEKVKEMESLQCDVIKSSVNDFFEEMKSLDWYGIYDIKLGDIYKMFFHINYKHDKFKIRYNENSFYVCDKNDLCGITIYLSSSGDFNRCDINPKGSSTEYLLNFTNHEVYELCEYCNDILFEIYQYMLNTIKNNISVLKDKLKLFEDDLKDDFVLCPHCGEKIELNV